MTKLSYGDLSVMRCDGVTLERLMNDGKVDRQTAVRHHEHMARFYKRLAKAMPKDAEDKPLRECITEDDLNKHWIESA